MLFQTGYYETFSMETIFLLAAIVLAFIAQHKVQSTFNKYLRVANDSGYTGYEVARKILDSNGLYDVDVVQIGGNLTDHYDPRDRILRLSTNVYSKNSIASIGVASHEVGHAIQHSIGYLPLKIRSLIAPIVSFGSRFLFIIIILGMLLSIPGLITLGVLIFLGIVIFQIITLPVEFDASNRAIKNLRSEVLTTEKEEVGVKKVLGAAAMTYVASALVSVANLLRMIGLSRRD